MGIYNQLLGGIGERSMPGLLRLRSYAIAKCRCIDENNWLFDFYVETLYPIFPNMVLNKLPWLMNVKGESDEEVFGLIDSLFMKYGFKRRDWSYQKRGHQFFSYYRDAIEGKYPDVTEVHVVIYNSKAYFCGFGASFSNVIDENLQSVKSEDDGDLFFCKALCVDSAMCSFPDFGQTPEEKAIMLKVLLVDYDYLLKKRESQFEAADSEAERERIRDDAKCLKNNIRYAQEDIKILDEKMQRMDAF